MNVKNQYVDDRMALYHGDSCEVLTGIPITVFTLKSIRRLLQVCTRILTAKETWAIARIILNFLNNSSLS
jgi:hypothetical protein